MHEAFVMQSSQALGRLTQSLAHFILIVAFVKVAFFAQPSRFLTAVECIIKAFHHNDERAVLPAFIVVTHPAL